MKKLALVAALILAASPAAAQVATSNAQELSGQELSGEGALPAPLQAPVTGVICEEEMTATFCNVPTAPSNGGYSSGSVTVGSSAPPASTPPCGDFPPPNELCN
jgi:hypothetical protein